MGALGNILGTIPGILGVLNGFGIGGNGLTSALSGIPPQELQLLSDEHGLLGLEAGNMDQRNQIVSDFRNRFGPLLDQVNPTAGQQYIDSAAGLINQGAGYIPQASQYAQNADRYVQAASPIIQQALDYIARASGTQDQALNYISGASPLIQQAMQMVQRGTPLINQGEQAAQAMTPDIARLRQFYGQLMDLGSPFYQSRQRQAMEASANQFQNNAGLINQIVARQGMGMGPSGVNTAGLGQLAQAASQSFADEFLKNLFNNEQLQLQAAQGFSNIPGMEAQQGSLFGSLANAASNQGNAAANVAALPITQGNAATNVANSQISQGNVTGNVARIPIEQANAEVGIAGIPIAQANAFGNLGGAMGNLGSIETAMQNLALNKAQAVNPVQALSNIPRMPSFPVNVNALPGISGLIPQKGGGGGGGGGSISIGGGGGGSNTGMNIPGFPGSGTTDPFLHPIWDPGFSSGFGGDTGPGTGFGPGLPGLIGTDPFGVGTIGGNPFAGTTLTPDPGVLQNIFGGIGGGVSFGGGGGGGSNGLMFDF